MRCGQSLGHDRACVCSPVDLVALRRPTAQGSGCAWRDPQQGVTVCTGTARLTGSPPSCLRRFRGGVSRRRAAGAVLQIGNGRLPRYTTRPSWCCVFHRKMGAGCATWGHIWGHILKMKNARSNIHAGFKASFEVHPPAKRYKETLLSNR